MTDHARLARLREQAARGIDMNAVDAAWVLGKYEVSLMRFRNMQCRKSADCDHDYCPHCLARKLLRGGWSEHA